MKRIVLLWCWLMPSILYAQKNLDFFSDHKSWEEVLRSAKEKNQSIMAYVYTSQNESCTKMDREVFTDSEVIRFSEKILIAIRIQFDSTKNDAPSAIYWRNWLKGQQATVPYSDLTDIPTFLFFTPDGKLVYKSSGLKDARSFKNISRFALDPERKNYKSDLAEYQAGKMKYSKMLDLARVTRNLVGDEKLTMEIAKDYKENHLDKLPRKSKLDREEVKFLNDYGEDLINPNDKFFYAAYHNPLQIDSVLGQGAASTYVSNVVLKYFILPVLFKNNKRTMNVPNWERLAKDVKKKYPKFNPDRLILNEMTNYYKERKDWNLYTKYQTELIEKYPPQDIFFGLNAPSWDVFRNCEDTVALNRAIKWIEMAIHRDPTGVQYIDTKANLLYKLGHKDSAIACERSAIELTKKLPGRGDDGKPLFMEEYEKIVEKMLKNEPTWK